MANFADDGAFGAGGPGMSTAPAPTFGSGASSTPASSANPMVAAGAAGAAPTADGTINYAPGGGGSGGSSFTPQEIPSAAPAVNGGGGAASGLPTAGGQGYNGPTLPGGVFFDAGGSVPDDNGQSQQQDPMSAILQQSLGSVDQTLQAMYKQFGLGDQSQTQGGVQDDAANMPTAPAGQSESGIAPQRPGPGTLPPTSNPFGQRQAANMPAIPGEGRGGGWDVPPLKPQGPGTQPMTPAPGTWKPPPRPGGPRTADAGGIQDDQETS